MQYLTPNATKKGLLPDEVKVPSEPAIQADQFAEGKAERRMGEICADADEVSRYKYDPNAARTNVHPGIPLEDGYNDTILGD